MKKVTLKEWFKINSIPGAFDIKKLQRWVREGRIVPAAEKVGRQYWVIPTAKLIKPPKIKSSPLLLEEIRSEATKLSKLDRITVLSTLIHNIG